MTTRARFIGIDKYLDPEAHDLSCASRDAVALWALFQDTFPDIDAELIVDEAATVSRMRQALLETLDNATESDQVILMFAGHGTRNHRLVAHDTLKSTLEDSSIAMSELADAFKRSRAKSIVCILDCCFSGATPARVLEDTPVVRELFAQTDLIKGTGRVMITASGLHEPAYEHTRLRHGLLTHALIETLCGIEGEVGLASIMDTVVDRVRAGARSTGFTQTPVALNVTEGGFKMGALRRGPIFYQEFPETTGIKVSHDIASLHNFGLPADVLQMWTEQFPGGLNDLQLEAVNDYRILDGNSLLVVAPTSSGKTFIGEMAAVQAVCEGRKAVFLLPYRALVNEKYEDFLELYGNRLGMRIIRCSGDYLDDTRGFILAKFDIAVLTYEMFLSLTVRNQAILSRLGLVVVDETQFISNEQRGIIVELILTQLRSGRDHGIEPQLLCLSATIGALNHFDEWLEVQSLVTTKRPIPLEMGVLDRNGVYEYIDASGNYDTKQLLSPIQIVQRKKKPSSQDVLVPLLQQLLKDQEKHETFLVFRNKRGSAEGCAVYLANELGLSAATDVVEELPNHDLSNTSFKLRQSLTGGVAVHNSNLLREERVAVEKAFRRPDSSVYGLVATTTIAAGVNTPASTVIIVEHNFPWNKQDFSVSEMKNMAGRAGRLGYRETGTAVILASNAYERTNLFRKYVLGEPEAATSSFNENQIGTWVLKLLAQVETVSEEEVVTLIANTYGGYLQSLKNPEWERKTKEYLAHLIPRMISAGLLEVTGEFVQLSLLGRACGESSLSFESALQFVELLRSLGKDAISSLDLMALVQVLPELDNLYTPLFRKGNREKVWPNQVVAEFGHGMNTALQRNVSDYWLFFGRSKRVCILLDWIRGITTEQIENQYTTNPFYSVGAGDIRGIADTTRFHLSSAFNIASVLTPSVFADPDEADNLLKRLELGIPMEALSLLSLPLPLTRGEYLALIAATITKPDDLWEFPQERLVAVLGEGRTAELHSFRDNTH